ncbi:hypothetical protein [Roseicitreum antarcticum]|uniref:hypothetical protein n=1 Tax=Roseicitreum antarcticum TaxID=564137 RepID=UPI00159FAAAA|nr:hypothetical protein [Roseicitreum antarcticum]
MGALSSIILQDVISVAFYNVNWYAMNNRLSAVSPYPCPAQIRALAVAPIL